MPFELLECSKEEEISPLTSVRTPINEILHITKKSFKTLISKGDGVPSKVFISPSLVVEHKHMLQTLVTLSKDTGLEETVSDYP